MRNTDCKRVTIISRFISAIKAFRGKPVSTLYMGVAINRCDECERKDREESTVFYICDREACDKCDNPECMHTPNIEHAKNFKMFKRDGRNCEYRDYWEVEHSAPTIVDGSSYFLTPEDTEVTLAECPVGLFEYNGTLGVKTGYCTTTSAGVRIDAYIVSSGERFCISNDSMVKPCGVWVAD